MKRKLVEESFDVNSTVLFNGFAIEFEYEQIIAAASFRHLRWDNALVLEWVLCLYRQRQRTETTLVAQNKILIGAILLVRKQS